MATIGLPDAQAQLAALIERVAAGEEITIVRDGAPVARLVPAVPAAGTETLQEWVERGRRMRRELDCRLGDLTIGELIHSGRRY